MARAVSHDLPVDAEVACERRVRVTDVVEADAPDPGPVDQRLNRDVIVSECRRRPSSNTMSLPWAG